MAKRGTDIATGRRIAVLGADGFIGSALVRQALAAGATVAAFCAKEPWRLRGVERDAGLELNDLGRWWERRRLEALYPDFADADAVALLAYRPPPDRMAARRHEHAVNAAGAIGVGEIAVRAGVRLVFTSSADVYGAWHEGPVSERTAPRPQTPYAEAKLEAERLLASRGAAGSVVNLRLATVYGPGEEGPRAIPSFIKAYLGSGEPVLHGDGTDVKDYVHVCDVAAGILGACLLPSPPPTANLGSGIGRSTEEVLREVAAAMDVEPRFRREPSPRAPSRLIVDPALAVRKLGFEPGRDFGSALRDEARWLRDRREAPVAA
jgi:UDP-glucose 4-epimerase